jgi:hypothetical protein
MPTSDFRSCRCCAHWHQERQPPSAENVVNTDSQTIARSPNFDHVLRTVSFKPARTDAGHSAGDGAAGAQFAEAAANAVTTEDEMLRLDGRRRCNFALHGQSCSHQNGLRRIRSAGFGGTRRDGLHQIDYHCCERIDLIAHKIRDLVREHVVENPPLVRAAWQGYIIRPRRAAGMATPL